MKTYAYIYMKTYQLKVTPSEYQLALKLDHAKLEIIKKTKYMHIRIL